MKITASNCGFGIAPSPDSGEGTGEGLRDSPILIDRRKRVLSKLLWTCLFSVLSLLAQRYIGWAQSGPRIGQKPAPAVGAAAINFELKSLDGKAVRLETFRGKPLVINFFASWCDPCRDEMPLINQLASKANKDGYAVLVIAVEDTRAAVTQYVEEAKLVFPVALDLNSTVKRAYRIFGPPATFFIDGNGVIRDMVIGPVTAERAREGLKKARAAR
jgi:thiol-disulfide isomerase/thioredoxin